MIKEENRMINLYPSADHAYTVDGTCTYHVPTFLRDIDLDVRTLQIFAEYVSTAVERYERAARAADEALRIDDGSPDSFNTYELAGDAEIVKRVLNARAHLEEMVDWLAEKI